MKRTTPRTRALSLAATLALALAGCAPNTSQEPPASQAPVPATAPSSASPDHGHAHDDSVQLPTGAPPTRPSWNAQQQRNAVAVATNATKAFLNTIGTAQDWRNRLKPFMNADTFTEYADTDPARVPNTEIKSVGAPRLNQAYPDFVDVPVQLREGRLNVSLKYSSDYTHLEVLRFEEADAA